MSAVTEKIVKAPGRAITELEQNVARALTEIEASNIEMKVLLKGIVFASAKEVEIKADRKAVVVFFPARVWKSVQKVQGRLIHELEKKFPKQQVIFVAQRTILDKDFRRRGLKVRPRTRTLTSVHEAMLDDIVGPAEIVGKRTHVSTDGRKTLKVILEQTDAHQEDRFAAYSAVYMKLTNKPALFMFEA
ncbi:40S ribosomal protein [Perkinsus chesapeaki]|uniref:40S ribosomal protein S7 n=1 Tax=Perkinsus chesapeaki TaxID=330153 RepID=A0A7J6MRE7_PERCH|nr:40S ribosomal protein [Perkinsus chesapeaki]